jgi:hypothetical protein
VQRPQRNRTKVKSYAEVQEELELKVNRHLHCVALQEGFELGMPRLCPNPVCDRAGRPAAMLACLLACAGRPTLGVAARMPSTGASRLAWVLSGPYRPQMEAYRQAERQKSGYEETRCEVCDSKVSGTSAVGQYGSALCTWNGTSARLHAKGHVRLILAPGWFGGNCWSAPPLPPPRAC